MYSCVLPGETAAIKKRNTSQPLFNLIFQFDTFILLFNNYGDTLLDYWPTFGEKKNTQTNLSKRKYQFSCIYLHLFIYMLNHNTASLYHQISDLIHKENTRWPNKVILLLKSVFGVKFYFSHVFRNQNFEPVPSWYPITYSESEKPQKLKKIFVFTSASKKIVCRARQPAAT